MRCRLIIKPMARYSLTRRGVEHADPLDREIDFRNGRRNPHFVEYHGPKVIRVLDPDVAELFPDNESVNAALRSVSATRPKKISARRVVAKKENR